MEIENFDKYIMNRFSSDPTELGAVKLIILNGNEKKRREKAEHLRERLNDFLATKENITKHRVEIYDCKDPKWKHVLLSDMDEFSGTHYLVISSLPFDKLRAEMLQGRVFVPIFHNADDVIASIYNSMWDNWYPTVFTVSRIGYKRLNKANYSKAACYDIIR